MDPIEFLNKDTKSSNTQNLNWKSEQNKKKIPLLLRRTPFISMPILKLCNLHLHEYVLFRKKKSSHKTQIKQDYIKIISLFLKKDNMQSMRYFISFIITDLAVSDLQESTKNINNKGPESRATMKVKKVKKREEIKKKNVYKECSYCYLKFFFINNNIKIHICNFFRMNYFCKIFQNVVFQLNGNLRIIPIYILLFLRALLCSGQ